MIEQPSGDAEVTEDPPLEQLIYASVSTPRVTSALQMSDILAVARPCNAKDGITGALTATRGRFVQIIEGPPSAGQSVGPVGQGRSPSGDPGSGAARD